MELVSSTAVVLFEANRSEKALYETKNLSKSIKENFKADSIISKKKIKKTKIKMQAKTKESLSFDTTTSNSNANSNGNNYCHNHDQTILNKLSEQDAQQNLNSKKLILNKIDANLNPLSPSTAQNMFVNNLQLAQNVKNTKLKKSKKIRKKNLPKSLHSRESTGHTQNNPSDKFEVDFDSLKDNESIRWQNELVDKKEEDERIELYKINRRKRYIEQKNKILKIKLRNDLAFDSSLSSSSTCSFDNLHSKNFQNNLENIVEVDKLDSITTDQKDKEENALVQDRKKSSSGCCLIVKREKETDSAISSISSNSQMFY